MDKWWSSQSNQACWHLIFLLFTNNRYPAITFTTHTMDVILLLIQNISALFKINGLLLLWLVQRPFSLLRCIQTRVVIVGIMWNKWGSRLRLTESNLQLSYTASLSFPPFSSPFLFLQVIYSWVRWVSNRLTEKPDRCVPKITPIYMCNATP